MYLILLAIFNLLAANSAHAELFLVSGKGIDGRACSLTADISPSGKLVRVTATGGVKRKLLDPLGQGRVGWREEYAADRAESLFSLPDESPTYYSYFRNNSSWFSSNKIFDFSSDDLPEAVVPTGTLVQLHLELTIDDVYLKKAHAVLTEKAFQHVNIESTEFDCELAHGARVIP